MPTGLSSPAKHLLDVGLGCTADETLRKTARHCVPVQLQERRMGNIQKPHEMSGIK